MMLMYKNDRKESEVVYRKEDIPNFLRHVFEPNNDFKEWEVVYHEKDIPISYSITY